MDRSDKQLRCDRRHQNHKKPKDRKRNEEDSYYRGREYCNIYEKRMAMLLAENEIESEYSKQFATVDRCGNPSVREVDFWLDRPRRLRGVSWPVQAIEVKGRTKSGRARLQRRELLAIGVRTFTATPSIINMWQKEGLLMDEGAPS